MTGHARKLDILVISAGQAGLAWGSISKKRHFASSSSSATRGSAKTPRT
jgi:3-methyladenine DNA glycosylase Tag